MIQITQPGMLRLGVLASGRGSNFDAICAAIDRGDLQAKIEVLISDKADAAALEKASNRGIFARFIDPKAFADRECYESEIITTLRQAGAELVVLAGYMRLVGRVMLQNYRWRILNIHPALLPSFTGLHAQKQAVEYGVRFSGCTVHIVDEGMDTGPIIQQAVVPVYQYDDEDGLATRILEQEHKLYWQSLQLFAQGRVYLDGHKVIIQEKNKEEMA
ncbi:MAG: phosphoribosylglycinamide formyltransferase [Deltaproteobacteria bacterium]